MSQRASTPWLDSASRESGAARTHPPKRTRGAGASSMQVPQGLPSSYLGLRADSRLLSMSLAELPCSLLNVTRAPRFRQSLCVSGLQEMGRRRAPRFREQLGEAGEEP